MTDGPRKVDAWMPLWIGDYLADTMGLTTEQHGAYLLILMGYWRNRGPLAMEDLPAISRLGVRWPRVKPKLERFFVSREGLWIHGRADHELADAVNRSQKAKAKASKAAAARWSQPEDASGNAPSIGQALLEQCPSPSPLPFKAKARSKDSASSAGSRLPLDWVMPDEWMAWAKKERQDINHGLEAAKFADHWHAQPGAKGRKSDWLGTWRNWVRNAYAIRGTASVNGRPSAAASFHNKVYKGTAEEDLPPELRERGLI